MTLSQKYKFAGTGRVLERLEHVCGHNYLYEQVCNVQVFIFKNRFLSGTVPYLAGL